MRRRTFIKKTGTAGLITLISPRGIIQSLSKSTNGDLEQIFHKPGMQSYPYAYWFWMNGHISKEGITLDLEAMKRIGIGGVFNFDAGTSIPRGPVQYMSTGWFELKEHAIREAGRLGLEFTMHNCPGWSSSGGPWITPELSMMQITWSESYKRGGNEIKVQLPKPFNKLNYYRDVVVLAFPALKGEDQLQNIKASSSGGLVSMEALRGEDPQGVNIYPANDKEPAWLQIEFSEPYEARSITFLISAVKDSNPGQTDLGKRTSILLESSENGIQFFPVATISTGIEAELVAGDKFITYDIIPTKVRYFRFSSTRPRRFAQVRFSGITRLKNFMEKTANRFMFSGEGVSNILTNDYQTIPDSSTIDLKTIQVITQYMNQDGLLQWNAPPGDWTIVRFGYTAIGTINKAAPDEGTGLECDKFSRMAIDFHFSKMMEGFIPLFKNDVKNGKIGLEIDSYEAGSQNWTPQFPKEFKTQRGYDLINYLPALTGRIVESIDHTERFLWDFRRTLADLMADNYYGRFSELCKQHNITSYIQPYDKGPFEEMQIGSRVDVNMGESWYGNFSILQGNLPIRRTLKLAASVAHINGKKIIGAEAFTSEPESASWQEYPFALKSSGDKMFTSGINRFIIHRFAHQPNSFVSPGMTMGPWGIHFDRTNTWFEKAKPWLQYLSRCQSMLQQGLFVADLIYFTGEEANIYTKVNPDQLNPVPPEGYDYDLVNADVILEHMKIENNLIVLDSGMVYRLLVLQDFKAISLKLLQKLRALVNQGMILVGAKPDRSLGLIEFPDNNLEFKKISNEMWSGIDGTTTTENSFGKGRIFWGASLNTILQKLVIIPDFEFSSRSGDAPINYIHRKTDNDDFYFIANQRRKYEELVCTFRVNNKQPEIWDPASGKIIPVRIYEIFDGRVRIPIQLEPYGSLFVVFRSSIIKNSFHSLVKDGTVAFDTKPYLLRPQRIFKEPINNFTITLWAKPEMNVMLRADIQMGDGKGLWTDYYAIYPPSGKDLYGDGHATCGLAIGRNGVAVWEHSSINPIQTLAAPVAISGWTHVALIYKNGVPSVIVNGKFLAEGKKSENIIHPALGDAYHKKGNSFYNGDMSEPQLIPKILAEEEIQQITKKESPRLQFPSRITEMASSNGKAALLFWQNGKYRLRNITGQTLSFSISGIDKNLMIDGPWRVGFLPKLGAPQQIILPQLISLHKHSENGVKYFSGTATYTKNFILSIKPSTGKRLFLDLGQVEVIAEININGKILGTLWKRPYSIEITDVVKTGLNKLEIRVTNLWPNRLIGDEQLPDPDLFAQAGTSGFEHIVGSGFENLIGRPIEKLPQWYIEGKPKVQDGRICFTTWKHYNKNSPLLESGLIGPVVIRTAILKLI